MNRCTPGLPVRHQLKSPNSTASRPLPFQQETEAQGGRVSPVATSSGPGSSLQCPLLESCSDPGLLPRAQVSLNLTLTGVLCGFLIPFHEPRATLLLNGKIENREQHVIIALKPVGFKLRASYLTSYVTLDTFSLL